MDFWLLFDRLYGRDEFQILTVTCAFATNSLKILVSVTYSIGLGLDNH